MKNLRIEKDFEVMRKEGNVSAGVVKVVNAYFRSVEEGLEELTITEFLWEKEQEEALEYLREVGVERIIIEDKSSGLMNNLHFLLSSGCTIEGPTVRDEVNWNDEVVEIKGLRIKL